MSVYLQRKYAMCRLANSLYKISYNLLRVCAFNQRMALEYAVNLAKNIFLYLSNFVKVSDS